MTKVNARDVPEDYVILDGRWVRRQASEALGTFVAPVRGALGLIGTVASASKRKPQANPRTEAVRRSI